MFLLEKYPRELCLNNARVKIAQSSKDVEDFINKNNGFSELHTSVFSYTQTDGTKAYYNSVVVDKIYIDIDPVDKNNLKNDICFELNKIIKYFQEQDLMFSINFSGRGFHFYSYCNLEHLINPAVALKNATNFIKEKTNAKIDSSVVGDIARETRLLNTINKRSGLFCIPIKVEELNNLEQIKELAKHKRALTSEFLYGHKLLSLKSFDTNEPYQTKVIEYQDSFRTESKIDTERFKKKASEIPCISEILQNDRAGWNERTLLLGYLQGKGFSVDDAEAVLKSFISEEKWKKSHCTRNHSRKYFSYGYSLKSCSEIGKLGLCPLLNMKKNQVECKFYEKLYAR